MGFIHGKGTAVSLDGKDLSIYANSVKFSREADTHDVTTFGKNSKRYQSGLKDGTAEISGIYDNTAMTGPGAVLRPLVGGLEVPLLYMPEGDDTGKPEAAVSVIVDGYEETAPVADMVTWSASLQFSSDVVDGTTGP